VTKIAVAIPVRDEAERIAACLFALDAQTVRPDRVVLLLDNCSDETLPISRALAPHLRFPLKVIRYHGHSQAGAGLARRLALQCAAEGLSADDMLLCTDADTVVPPDWISRNRYAFYGADVVCGRAVIDPVEARLIPEHLHADDRLECRLIALLDRLAAYHDPDPHDPWPRHTECSGASLAVRVGAWRRVGGIPALSTGEDRAFVRLLWLRDARVRHDPDIEVTVSGRIEGRAEGGMAETMRRRLVQQDEFTDAEVEPTAEAAFRYRLRRRVRRAWSGSPDVGLAAALGLTASGLAAALAHPWFGTAWDALEATSPLLARRPVRFSDLAREIALAEAALQAECAPDSLAAD
jgi:hypothetical protein